MKVIYLSSLCSKKEYERMFNIYGTTSSHASQKFHRSIVQGLTENGLNVTALSYRAISKPQLDDLIKEPDVESKVMINYLPHHKTSKLNRVYTIFKTYGFLHKWFKENKDGVICSDIINGEFSIAIFIFSILHKCKKVAIVTDVPSCRAMDTRKGLKSIPPKIKNYLIQQFDGYVFLTEQMDSLLNPKHKPFVVMEGVIDESAAQVPNVYENKYPECVCMMAGLLEKEFGVDTLLEEFSKIDNDDLKLNFYGKGKSVQLILDYSKKDKRICYGGELLNSQILEEERKSTLLINPRPPIGEWTKYSFPSKNIEYISSGTPMIAYKLDGMPKEYYGHFYHIKDGDIGKTLREVLEYSREELHQFGCSAREWILKEKTPKNQTESLAKLIRNF